MNTYDYVGDGPRECPIEKAFGYYRRELSQTGITPQHRRELEIAALIYAQPRFSTHPDQATDFVDWFLGPYAQSVGGLGILSTRLTE
jgi:hypothetical protein